MKFNLSLILISTQVAHVFSAAASVAATECGTLGVMEVPNGVDPVTVRMCKEHPLERRPRLSSSSVPPDSTKRVENILSLEHSGDNAKCYYAAPYGCDNNYCWRSCGEEGDGKWCWLAQNGGSGQWTQCRSWEDCLPEKTADSDCGKNCVGSCGCDC